MSPRSDASRSDASRPDASRLRAAAAALALTAGLTVLVAASTSCRDAGAAAASAAPAGGELVAHRGDLHQRLLLTGELVAVRAVDLTVPPSPNWQVQISWLEEDGAEVHAGQKLVEFDTTQFSNDLDEKRRALREKENDLARTEAEGRVAEAEKRFAIEQRRAELEKAQSRADVPEGLLAQRELEERRLARERATVALTKAEADLEATLAANRADLEMRRLEIGGARREIEVAEKALDSGTLRAPVDGIFVVGDHPWEGRKLQEGESVWVGMTVGRIPDLASMQVEAALSDVDDGLVGPGMRARCTLDAYPDTAYPCRVAEVAPVAQELPGSPLLRAFKTRLELAAAEPARLRPGMSVKVEVATLDRVDVLLAPRAALDPVAVPPRARLAAGGTTEVTLGPCTTQECTVEEGLAVGDRLAVFHDALDGAGAAGPASPPPDVRAAAVPASAAEVAR